MQGFCPSFVTIHGGELKKRKGASNAIDFSTLPLPVIPKLERPWNILVTGIGGTGVVTIGALVGMAAHLEGKGATILDQTGLAQKGGAVTCHIRIANAPAEIHAVRIAAGEADLVLGCDMVVVNDYWALSKIRKDRTHVVLNTYEAMPGTFTRNADMQFPAQQIIAAVRLALGNKDPDLVDATEIATALLGDSIATNLFVLGFAWQKGWVPVSLEALMRAIELNAAAVEMNKSAFNWGRLAAHDMNAVRVNAGLGSVSAPSTELPINDRYLSTSVDEQIERRVRFLTDYQDAAYADKYRALVDRVRTGEKRAVNGTTSLTEAVARYAFKLMAYKDEYEVARLYTNGEFLRQIEGNFGGNYRIAFNLAPPLFSRRDENGRLVKREYGAWMFTAFKFLAKLKGLRGGSFDIFGKTAERRMERKLVADYFATVEQLIDGLNESNHALAVEIAKIPEQIRGYGHVKEEHLAKTRVRWEELMAAWRTSPQAQMAA